MKETPSQTHYLPIEMRCISLIKALDKGPKFDPSHDYLHFLRVRNLALKLSSYEKSAPIEFHVLMPAAWLHDLNAPEKDSPDRKKGSVISAAAALKQLKEWDYPEEYYSGIAHAIEAHSYSANIPPLTMEAKLLQDADRLDALGVLGIVRCFSVGGRLNRPFYDESDPAADHRAPDDSVYTLDHFQKKLFNLPDLMQTDSGRKLALERMETLKQFIRNLKTELFL